MQCSSTRAGARLEPLVARDQGFLASSDVMTQAMLLSYVALAASGAGPKADGAASGWPQG